MLLELRRHCGESHIVHCYGIALNILIVFNFTFQHFTFNSVEIAVLSAYLETANLWWHLISNISFFMGRIYIPVISWDALAISIPDLGIIEELFYLPMFPMLLYSLFNYLWF